MASATSPSFEPGSGGYQAGQWTPSSDVDRREMRKAALATHVVVLRRRGERIPAERLLRVHPVAGLLVCSMQYTHPHWHACLFADGMQQELLPKLLHVHLVRENAGVRLYQGIQIDERVEYRQAWLCTPTPGRAREILLTMLEQEGGAV